MNLTEFVDLFLPEPSCGCTSWAEHTEHLWRESPLYLDNMITWLHVINVWPITDPIVVDDGYVQDGHHRVVSALILDWYDREVLYEEA